MRISCGFCGRAYAVRDGLRGRAYRMTCRACGRDFVVRLPQSATPGEPPPFSVPDRNPFRVAPVTARARSADAEPAAALHVVGPARAGGVERALALAATAGADGELEDLGRALSLVIDDADEDPPRPDEDERRGNGLAPEGAVVQVRAPGGEGATPRFPGGPAAEVLGMATRGGLGPRIALGLAALVVISIAGAVLLAPRSGRTASPTGRSLPGVPPPIADRALEGAAPGAQSPLAPPAEAAAGRALLPDGPSEDRREKASPSAVALAERAPGAAPGSSGMARKPDPKAPSGGAAQAASARTPAEAAAGEAAPAPPSGDAFARALSSNMAGFDACVAEAVKRDPGLDLVGRKVTLLLTVAPNGTVSYPTLDDAQLSGSELGACFQAAARHLTGPTFVGEPQQVELSLLIGGPR